MQFKKIIFFICQPLSARDYERFGIEILRQNGFSVEVWDFTPFLRPQLFKEIKVPDPINYEGHRLFLHRDNALKAISKLKNDSLPICMFHYNYNSYIIYRALSKNKIKYCIFMANNNLPPFPSNDNSKNLLKRIKKLTPKKLYCKLKQLISKDLLQAIFLHTKFNYLGIQAASMVLAGGEKSINYRAPVSKKTKILWLHTLDYDIYLKENDKPIQIERNNGVFLDENVPFHPNYLIFGVSPFSQSEEYYPILCRFFDFLENKYGIHILIAAHPSSHYENHPEYFGRRPIIRGRTAELVRKTAFTIAHSSTAINFALLFRKPIIFITTDGLNCSPQGLFIDLMASLFGKKAINLNNHSLAIDWNKECTVDEEAFRRYKNDYIKKDDSEDLLFWQIFANHMKLMA